MRRSSMRGGASLLLILATSLLAAVEHSPTALRAAAGAERTTIDRILMAFSRGEGQDLSWLESADPAWFTAPIGHSGEDGVMRHWTQHLPAALDRLPAERRRRAVAILDRLFHTGPLEPQRAAAFLPAPAALAVLRDHSARLFDRGEAVRFLVASATLDRHRRDWDRAPRRRAVAAAMLGRRDDPILGPAIPTPGRLEAVDGLGEPILDHQGRSVRWHRHDHLLLALDAWDRTRWQFPLERRTRRVLTGPGGALIEAPHALLLLDEQGAVEELLHPPGIRPLAIGAGAAWFAQGSTIHVLDLAQRSRQRFDLPAPPLGPPLVGADRQLWLTARELLVLDTEGTIHARWAHHRELAEASLLRTVDGIALVTDQEQWLLRPPPSAEASLAEHVRYLIAADRHAQALALWREHAAPEALAPEVLRAVIAGAGDAETATRAYHWSDQTQWRARLALARGAPWPQGTWRDRLITLAAEQPTVLAPLDTGGDPLAPADDWRHTISLHSLAAALREGVDADHATTTCAAERDGRWVVVSSHDADGALRWRHHLPSVGFHRPGLQCVQRGDWVLVIEGATHIRVLEAASGRLRGEHRLPVVAPLEHIAATPHLLAWLTPLRAPDHLHVAQAGNVHHIALPSTAERLHIRDGAVGVTLHGGETRWWTARGDPQSPPASVP